LKTIAGMKILKIKKATFFIPFLFSLAGTRLLMCTGIKSIQIPGKNYLFSPIGRNTR
jgi:hypothetical protein